MLTVIKLWASLSLLSGAAWAFVGYARNKRLAEAKAEYRWHMSPIYLHEPLNVIRAKELIL